MKKNIIFLFILATSLSACGVFSGKDYEQQLKSPCVGINGSPCQHIPVNDKWLNDYYTGKMSY